jgi:hypothetical protein
MFSVKKGGFIGELWASFKSIQGLAIAVLAFLAAIILYLFDSSDDPSGRIAVSLNIVMYTLLILLAVTALDAAYRLHRAAKGGLPRVILGRNPPAGSRATLTCMLEPSELFSYGIAVSIYKVDDEGFESLVGIGNVTNIQGDGRIQVLVERTMAGHEEFAESIKNNEQKAIRAARVKPSVEQQFFVGYGDAE